MVKKISAVMTGVFLLLTSIQLLAQSRPAVKSTEINPYYLAISYSKTTNLIFPFPVISVDRGSKDILAQKAKGMENILQIKAGKMGFNETNLTVITSDGNFYSYVLNYAEHPTSLNIKYDNNASTSDPTAPVNEAEIKKNAESILGARATIHNVRDKSFEMTFRLEGIYIKGDVMYYQVTIKNNTNVNYTIDQLRFYVKDLKKSKRTATQEIELVPIYRLNNSETIEGHSTQAYVFALPKSTIPDQKFMNIQLMEKDGGRHLDLHFGNKTILKARTIRE